MRHAHYWKLAGAKCAPSEIIVVDTETWHGDRAKVSGGELHTLRLGCAMAYRLEHGQRTRIRRITFTHADDFWALLQERLCDRRPVWVFAHNAPYDLGILGGWKWICSPDVLVEKVAVSGQLFYIKSVIDGCGVVFADTLNYYRCSLSAIGKAVGLPKMQMPEQSEPDSVWAKYCANDVEVTAAAVDSLIEFTRKEGLGPWQPSIASLAFSGYRAGYMKDKVLVHDTDEVLRMERNAYYGGIVDTPFVGTVPKAPIHELDVCSMYPTVCQHPLPTRIAGKSRNLGPKVLTELAKKYMLVAEVTIESCDYPYPCRLKGGTYFPVGRFTTTLAHPELMHALESGKVKWVHRAAWYHHAPIFASYMKHFVAKKSEYRAAGNDAFATICKYYANSLYGKTGQLSPKWVAWDADAMRTLEKKYGLPEGSLVDSQSKPPDLYELEEHARLPGVPEPIDVRNYYGMTELKVGEFESRDSCPIIAATVTSYARQLLRSYQAIAGSGEWYYCDTDSIWVTDRGRANLESAGCVRPDELGYLDVKGTHKFLTVHGPKDYATDLVMRRKGVRMGAIDDGEGGWIQLHFPGAGEQIKANRSGGVFVAEVTKHLHRRLTKCVRLTSGYTRPLKFPDENPDLQKPTRWKGKRERT